VRVFYVPVGISHVTNNEREVAVSTVLRQR
jgi:hypothetical protein